MEMFDYSSRAVDLAERAINQIQSKAGKLELQNQERLQVQLAEVLHNRAISEDQLKKVPDAFIDFNRGIDILQRRVGANKTFGVKLAQMISDRGNLFIHLRRYQEALRDKDQAVKMLEDLAEQNHPELQDEVAVTLNSRANVYMDSKQPAKAVGDLDRVIAIYRSLISRGQSQFQGRLERAINFRQRILKDFPIDTTKATGR